MRCRFEDCEFDVARRRLIRAGCEVPLQPKVFELLELLLLHRARVVPKALLLRELWPDTCVTPASVTRLVKEARRALGDDGRRQRVIQTLHGFGYRFVAEVHSEDVRGPSELERAIELARRSLEASLESGASDLRSRVRDFTETCLVLIRATGREASG